MLEVVSLLAATVCAPYFLEMYIDHCISVRSGLSISPQLDCTVYFSEIGHCTSGRSGLSISCNCTYCVHHTSQKYTLSIVQVVELVFLLLSINLTVHVPYCARGRIAQLHV